MSDAMTTPLQVDHYFELLERSAQYHERAQQVTDSNRDIYESVAAEADNQLSQLAADPEVEAYMAETSRDWLVGLQQLGDLQEAVDLGLLSADKLAEKMASHEAQLQADPRLAHAVSFMRKTGLVEKEAVVEEVPVAVAPVSRGEALFERRKDKRFEAEGQLTEFPLGVTETLLLAGFMDVNKEVLVKRGLQPLDEAALEALEASEEGSAARREAVVDVYGTLKTARELILAQLKSFFADPFLVQETLETMPQTDPRYAVLTHVASHAPTDYWNLVETLAELVDAEQVSTYNAEVGRRVGTLISEVRPATILGGRDLRAEEIPAEPTGVDDVEIDPEVVSPAIPPIDMAADAMLTMLHLDEPVEPVVKLSEQQKEIMHERINSGIVFENARQFDRAYRHQLTAILERLEDAHLMSGTTLLQLQRADLIDRLDAEDIQEAYNQGLIGSADPADLLKAEDVLRLHALKYYPEYIEKTGFAESLFSMNSLKTLKSPRNRVTQAQKPDQDQMLRTIKDEVNSFKEELRRRAAERAEAEAMANAERVLEEVDA